MGVIDKIRGRLSALISGGKEAAAEQVTRGEDRYYRYSGIYGYSGNDPYQQLQNALSLDADLMQRYAEYEEMGQYPEIGSALDIYADDATIPDKDHGRSIWPISTSRIVREVLDDLLQVRLRFEEDVWRLARTLAKYGDAYGEILATEDGVIGVNLLPPPTIRRIESDKGTLIGFVQDVTGKFDVAREDVARALKEGMTGKVGSELTIFAPYEVVHWRLMGKDVSSPYGTSVLEPARWIWRRLVMAEDTALVYKLTRAPARFAFYVDVGDLPPERAIAYLNEIKQKYKKNKIYNPSTGKIDFRDNPLGPNEDFWIPTRNGQESTRIDVIAGPDYQAVEDLEYFQRKLFAALKVPREYLGFGEDESRASLSQKDVAFARTVMRLQRELRNGVKMIARVHLAVLGIDPDQISFDFRMTAPSPIFEMSQIEVQNARADLADRLRDWMPKEWILKTIFGFTDDDAAYITQSKEDEARKEAYAQAEIQADLASKFGFAPEIEQESPRRPGRGTPSESVERKLDALVERFERAIGEAEKNSRKLDEIRPAMKEVKRTLRLIEGAASRRRSR